MERTYGVQGIKALECINPRLQIYRVRWDFQPYTGENMEEGVSFIEAQINHKPTLDEIKNIVLEGFNRDIDYKILTGFVWRGMSVWLSMENQFNYKSICDVTIQTNGANLPVTLKFGTMENPQYYEFQTKEDILDFYSKSMTFINDTIQEGWEAKDSIDWTQYDICK